jgi:hypothetical protein
MSAGSQRTSQRTEAQRTVNWRVLARGAAFAALASVAAGCASIQHLMPDPASFKLPDRTTFLPTNTAAFAGPVSAVGSVGPGDLVDGQGFCAPGAVPASADGFSAARSVGLEMTECQVVRTLGQPQSVEISPQLGQRRVLMTYSGERAGIYQFVDGRLASVERGNEPPPPPPPPVAKKPAKKPPPA